MSDPRLQQDANKIKKINLYLRVHIMPTLNRPLGGQPWQWIVPFIAFGILVIALVYFFGT